MIKMVKNSKEIVNHILYKAKFGDGIMLSHKQHERLETRQQERLEHEWSRKEKKE